MKKSIVVFVFSFILSGCASTNEPEAPKAKGEWQSMITNLQEIQAR